MGPFHKSEITLVKTILKNFKDLIQPHRKTSLIKNLSFSYSYQV